MLYKPLFQQLIQQKEGHVPQNQEDNQHDHADFFKILRDLSKTEYPKQQPVHHQHGSVKQQSFPKPAESGFIQPGLDDRIISQKREYRRGFLVRGEQQ